MKVLAINQNNYNCAFLGHKKKKHHTSPAKNRTAQNITSPNVKTLQAYTNVKQLSDDEIFLNKIKKDNRFNDEERTKLSQMRTVENKQFIDNLLDAKEEGYMGKLENLYYFDDIFSLLKIRNSSNSKFMDKLVSQKKEIYSGNKVARFTAHEVRMLTKTRTDKNEEFMNYLVDVQDTAWNGEKFSRFEAKEIKKITLLKDNKNEELLNILLNKKVDNGNHHLCARFSNISEILKLRTDENEPFIRKIIEKEDYNSKTRWTPRFNDEEVLKLVKLRTNENKDYLDKLVDVQASDKDNKYGYKYSTIEKVIHFRKNRKEFIETVTNAVRENEKCEKESLFPNDELFNLLEIYKKYPKIPKGLELLARKGEFDFIKMINTNNYKIFSNEDNVKTILAKIPSDGKEKFVCQKYVKDNYTLGYKKDNKDILYNYNLNSKGKLKFIASEEIVTNDKTKRSRRSYPTGQTLVEEVNYDDKWGVVSQRKTLFSKEHYPIRSEVVSQSKEKPNEYTINVYERGLNKKMQKQVLGSVKVYGTEKQGLKVEKVLTSSNGTKTIQKVITGPRGSYSSYDIISKDGDSLFSNERRFRKIDDEHFESSLNGQKYEMNFENENKILVTKIGQDDTPSKTISLKYRKLEPQFKELYKKLPGDFFFDLKEMQLAVTDNNEEDNGAFIPIVDCIAIGKLLKENPFVFAHELGHAADEKKFNKFNQDKNLNEIFQKELVQYKKATAMLEGLTIDYFTTMIHENEGGCLTEVIAETYALLSGLRNDYTKLSMRGIILQQHFPETMAYIGNKMSQ